MELKMIEMRWLVRPGWDGPEKILQYRQKQDVTNYSTLTTNGDYLKEMVWSDWKDVPTVED
jgi:hypothetical protein